MDSFIFALDLLVDLLEDAERVNETEIAMLLRNAGVEEPDVQQILGLLGISERPVYLARPFSRTEKRLFTRDALQYLERMLLTGALDIYSLEDVMESALESEVAAPMDVQQAKALFLAQLLRRRSGLSGKISDEASH